MFDTDPFVLVQLIVEEEEEEEEEECLFWPDVFGPETYN